MNKRSSLLLLTMVALAALSGCTAMLARNPDGSIKEPREVDQDKVAAAQAGVQATGAAFGPIGIAVSSVLTSAIGAGALIWSAKLKGENGQLKGEKIGYDQGSLDAGGKPLASAGK